MSFDKVLCHIVKSDRIDLTEFLLLNNANINYVDENNKSFIDIALEHQQYSQIKFLIGHGAKITNKDELLKISCDNKDIDLLKTLLNDGANIGSNGNKLLEIAYDKNNVDLLKILLDNGMDPNAELFIANSTGLYHACHSNKIEIVKLLLRYKNTDINKADEFDVTPLRIACVYAKSTIVKLLMDAGADPNIQDIQRGKTALIRAIEYKNKDCFDILLSYSNIKIDLQDYYGNTALIYAIMSNEEELIDKIIQYGADITLKNKEGKSAIDYVKSDKIVTMLIEKPYQKCPTDKYGKQFPLLIQKSASIYIVKAICLGEYNRTNLNILKNENLPCLRWDNTRKIWEDALITPNCDYIIEITKEKMHYHVDPRYDDVYIRFKSLKMTDGSIRIMDDLYE
jgi:ankyrin repeat protein